MTIGRISVSMPAMKRILLISALLALTSGAAEARVTAAECKADYDAMVAEIERNRDRSLDELNQQLRFASDDDTANALNHQIEQTYHLEETFRGTAAIQYRDCMKYAEGGGS